ncbi:MAG: PsiF family protein, partial [Bryobacteraceae bacterium]
MSKFSNYLRAAVMSLLLVTSLTSVTEAKAAPSSTASSQDKAKACNDAADKQGLKDQARKTFMQNCLNKAAGSSDAKVSEQDKGTTCKNLA